MCSIVIITHNRKIIKQFIIPTKTKTPEAVASGVETIFIFSCQAVFRLKG